MNAKLRHIVSDKMDVSVKGEIGKAAAYYGQSLFADYIVTSQWDVIKQQFVLKTYRLEKETSVEITELAKQPSTR